MLAVLLGFAQAETEFHFTRGRELLLFNENGVMAYLTGEVEDTGMSWIRLNAIIENGNDFPVGVTYDGTGNGWAIGRCYFGDSGSNVPAHSKASSYMFLQYDKLNITRFSDLDYITVSFEIYEPSSGSVINLTPTVYFRTDDITIRFSGDKNAVRNRVFFDESPSLPKPESYTDVDRGSRNSTAVNNKMKTLSYSYGPMNKKDKVADVLEAYINGLKADGYTVSGSGKGYTVKNGSKKLCTITSGNKMKVDIQLGNENLRTLPKAAAGKANISNKSGVRQTLSPTMAPETPTPEPTPVPTPEPTATPTPTVEPTETPAPEPSPASEPANEIPDLRYDPETIRELLGMEVTDDEQDVGLLIVNTDPDGSAALSGIMTGDILVGLDKMLVFSEEDLTVCLAGKQIGDSVTAVILRQGDKGEADQSTGKGLMRIDLRLGKDSEETRKIVVPVEVLFPKNIGELEDLGDSIDIHMTVDGEKQSAEAVYPDYRIYAWYNPVTGKLSHEDDIQLDNQYSAKDDGFSLIASYNHQDRKINRCFVRKSWKEDNAYIEITDFHDPDGGYSLSRLVSTADNDEFYYYSTRETEQFFAGSEETVLIPAAEWMHIIVVDGKITVSEKTPNPRYAEKLVDIQISGQLQIADSRGTAEENVTDISQTPAITAAVAEEEEGETQEAVILGEKIKAKIRKNDQFVYFDLGNERIALACYIGADPAVNVGDVFPNAKEIWIMDWCFTHKPKEYCGKEMYIVNNTRYQCTIKVTDVILPETVTRIDHDAFGGTSALKSVNIPGSLQSIGDAAFSNCYLTELPVIPDGVELPRGLYYGCMESRVSVPDSYTVLPEMCFWASRTQEFALPATLKEIGKNAFQFCRAMSRIDLPEGLRVIGETAFEECEQLTDLVLPETLESLGNGAFTDCTALQTVVIREGLTAIPEMAFCGCGSLKSVTLPSSIQSIAESAFSECPSTVVFTVRSGSYAEKWAKEHGFSVTT